MGIARSVGSRDTGPERHGASPGCSEPVITITVIGHTRHIPHQVEAGSPGHAEHCVSRYRGQSALLHHHSSPVRFASNLRTTVPPSIGLAPCASVAAGRPEKKAIGLARPSLWKKPAASPGGENSTPVSELQVQQVSTGRYTWGGATVAIAGLRFLKTSTPAPCARRPG